MRIIWFFTYFCHTVLAGNLYPTSYVPASNLVAPQPVSALHYASPLRTSTGYGPLAAARVSQIAAPLLAPAPALATAPAPALAVAPAPAVYAGPGAYSAPVLARYPVPTAYAAPIAPVTPLLQKYAIPAVANVPVTRYVAQPGYIQKYVDVAHPKVATTKIQIRRPAIQKQFYDIEERIIVRPIASAVLELDQPLSRSQAGPTVIRPALHAAPGAVPIAAPFIPASTYGPPQPLPPPSAPQNPDDSSPSAPQNPEYPSAPDSPQFPPQSPPENPQFPPPSAPQSPQFPPPSAPQSPQFPPPSAPQNPQIPEISAPGNQESDDSDSITVENENVRARMSGFRMQQPQIPQTRQQQPQIEARSQQQSDEPQTEQPEGPQTRSGPSGPQDFMSQSEATSGLAGPQPMSQTEARFLSRSQAYSNSFNNFPSLYRTSSENLIPSSRSQLSDEQSQSNQQRLIELLTGRGGIAEVRSGVSVDAASEAGQIRGRVLSVTPAPPSSGAADERVSTRRVVVSRPIQTLQEVDVVQPFTKLQRLSVQHPAILKTPTVGIARVKTFAPVPVTTYGAYTPYTYIH